MRPLRRDVVGGRHRLVIWPTDDPTGTRASDREGAPDEDDLGSLALTWDVPDDIAAADLDAADRADDWLDDPADEGSWPF